MLPFQQPQGKYIPLPPGNNIPIYMPPQNLPETFIDLNTKQKAGIRNIISAKERIFYAGVIPKVNHQGVVQERILVITNRFVYNIDQNNGFFASISLCSSSGYSIKRKIQINRIDALTLSINPTCEKQQFIIHVRGERDYLFNGRIGRERIIKSLFNAHFSNTLEFIGLFLRDESNLSKFQTSNSDVRCKKTKRPQGGIILVTPELAARGIEWIIFNKVFLANLTRPFHGSIPSQQYNQYPVNNGFYPNGPNQGGFPSNGYQAPYGGNGYGIPNQPYQGYDNRPQFYLPDQQNNQGNFQAHNQGPISYPQYPQQNTQNTQNQQQNELKYNPQDYNSSSYPQQNNTNNNTQAQNGNNYQGMEKTMPHLYAAPNSNVQINSFAPVNDYKAPQNGNFPGQGNYKYGPQ